MCFARSIPETKRKQHNEANHVATTDITNKNIRSHCSHLFFVGFFQFKFKILSIYSDCIIIFFNSAFIFYAFDKRRLNNNVENYLYSFIISFRVSICFYTNKLQITFFPLPHNLYSRLFLKITNPCDVCEKFNQKKKKTKNKYDNRCTRIISRVQCVR